MHTYQVEREPKGEYSKPSAAAIAVRPFILDRNVFSGSKCVSRANNHAHHIVTWIRKRKIQIVGHHRELPKPAARLHRSKVHQARR